MSGAGGDVAISVRGLSKRFKVYSRPRDMLWELITRRPRHTECRALKDVSFEVRRGEVVGIIGRNGAGKSTLLKILAGTLDKTSGDAVVNGKVSAILELGTGFHPEYTGRENVIMGGLCLGMSRQEIESKVDSIIEFSELREVINQPFRTYSSGMQARLTFSVAASVEPDVLIIDEALSVGDALFAEKCYNRIREIAAGGATVLYVTHAFQSIYELCNRAILLHQGALVAIGHPKDVGATYEDVLRRDRAKAMRWSWGPPGPDGGERQAEQAQADRSAEPAGEIQSDGAWVEVPRPEDSPTYVEGMGVYAADGSGASVLEHGKRYTVRVRCRSLVDHDNISVGFRIQKPQGSTLYGTSTQNYDMTIPIRAGHAVEVDFDWQCNLQNGQYVLNAGVAKTLDHLGRFVVLHLAHSVLVFTVSTTVKFMGDYNMNCTVKVRQLTEGDGDASAELTGGR